MHKDFKNKGSSLGLFVEECGEALSAAGKSLRYGLNSYNPLLPPGRQEKNRDWLSSKFWLVTLYFTKGNDLAKKWLHAEAIIKARDLDTLLEWISERNVPSYAKFWVCIRSVKT